MTRFHLINLTHCLRGGKTVDVDGTGIVVTETKEKYKERNENKDTEQRVSLSLAPRKGEWFVSRGSMQRQYSAVLT